MISILINLLLAIHVIVSLLIILVVLMQRPKNEGLGAAFGGGMTENIFGAQTTNVLAGFTRWLGGAFFFLTLTLSMLYAKQTRQDSAVRDRLMAPSEMEMPAVPDVPPAEGAAPDTPVEPTEPDATPAPGAAAEPDATPTPLPAAESPAPAATP